MGVQYGYWTLLTFISTYFQVSYNFIHSPDLPPYPLSLSQEHDIAKKYPGYFRTESQQREFVSRLWATSEGFVQTVPDFEPKFKCGGYPCPTDPKMYMSYYRPKNKSNNHVNYPPWFHSHSKYRPPSSVNGDVDPFIPRMADTSAGYMPPSWKDSPSRHNHYPRAVEAGENLDFYHSNRENNPNYIPSSTESGPGEFYPSINENNNYGSSSSLNSFYNFFPDNVIRRRRSVPKEAPKHRTARSSESYKVKKQNVIYHACCISKKYFTTMEFAYNIDFELRKIAQFDNQKQYFTMEECEQQKGCDHCNCRQDNTAVSAVVEKNGHFFLDFIRIKGCCRCMNF